MSDKARVHSALDVGNVHEFYDLSSHERVNILSPLQWRDDFLGAGAAVAVPAMGAPTVGVDWTKKIVGSGPPTIAVVANGANGQMQIALEATSQKQDAALTWNDSLALDITKSLIWEARVRLSVLPSRAEVQAVWGVANAWIDGPDNNTYYLQFGATGTGDILLRSQDGVTQNSLASGVTVLATDWHIYRIDATDVTDIKYFIDGVRVSTTGTVAFAATGANAITQPYFAMYKASQVGLGTMLIDYVKAWTFRA